MIALQRHAALALLLGGLALASTPPASPAANAQWGAARPGADRGLGAEERAALIERACELLASTYVFPEKAEEMARLVRAELEKGTYDAIDSSAGFAARLETDLRSVCHDRHLTVRYSSEPLPERGEDEGPDPERMARRLAQMRARNYGFERVERLPGNVGYLDLRGFLPLEHASQTAAAAMNFLANSDALIVDLRQNGGGSPATVAFLSTYLFGAEPVHLNDLYFRPDDSTHQWWTLPHVPGPRVGPDAPVFVLTSRYTFSAAEEFTYNLKNLERATIVGEVTGGGAHPVDFVRLGEHFEMGVPLARAINPISGTNWEGTGVQPDVEVAAEDALMEARLLAVERLLEGCEDAERRALLEQARDELVAAFEGR